MKFNTTAHKQDLKGDISMDGSKEVSSRPSKFDIMLGWLGTDNEIKLRAATKLLCGLGKPAAECLVGEALRPGKRPEHMIRILDVVQQIGGPLGPDEMFGLQSLLGHRNQDIREKAERVIMSLSPSGVPDNPTSAALMRAFNPFLQPPRSPSSRPRRTKRLVDFAAALKGDHAAALRRARSSAAWEKREEKEQGKKS
jgi:hypothetical protein